MTLLSEIEQLSQLKSSSSGEGPVNDGFTLLWEREERRELHNITHMLLAFVRPLSSNSCLFGRP
jgi:hypothetical protein